MLIIREPIRHVSRLYYGPTRPLGRKEDEWRPS